MTVLDGSVILELIQVMEGALNNPPLKYEPARQSLKAWVMYCLRDRGFKVVYAEKGDFAIETRTGEKLYFKVTTQESEATGAVGWIVMDQETQQVKIVMP